MDAIKLIHITIFFLIVLFKNCFSQEECTSGFLDPLDEENYEAMGHSPIPLLGGEGPEQWIFPRMKFTCYGLLTTWIFRGFGGKDDELQLTTWKPDPLINTFRRVSRTNSSVANVTISENGSVFTYELHSPVPVEPGHIVGIEVVSPTPRNTKNILCLDVTEKGRSFLSYTRPFRFNVGFRPRDIYESYRAVLIDTVIEVANISMTGKIPSSESDTHTFPASQTSPENVPITFNGTLNGKEAADSNNNEGVNNIVNLLTFKVGIIVGNLFVILIAVIVSVSVVWIVKCIRSRRKASIREKSRKDVQIECGSLNNSWTNIQLNTAYRKAPDSMIHLQTSRNKGEWLRQADRDYPESQSDIYEVIDSGYETIDRKGTAGYEGYTMAEAVSSSIVLHQSGATHKMAESEAGGLAISEARDTETIQREEECESLVDCEAYTLTQSMREQEEVTHYVESTGPSRAEKTHEEDKKMTKNERK